VRVGTSGDPRVGSGCPRCGRVQASLTAGPPSAGASSCPWDQQVRALERVPYEHRPHGHDERSHHDAACRPPRLLRGLGIGRPNAGHGGPDLSLTLPCARGGPQPSAPFPSWGRCARSGPGPGRESLRHLCGSQAPASSTSAELTNLLNGECARWLGENGSRCSSRTGAPVPALPGDHPRLRAGRDLPENAEPMTITDVNGHIGYAIIDGAGTRTDTTTGAATRYSSTSTCGSCKASTSASTAGPAGARSRSSDWTFTTIQIADDAIHVNPGAGRASLRARNLPVRESPARPRMQTAPHTKSYRQSSL
jgi:hypothetical protein